MPKINELDSIPVADISDDDFIIIYDQSAAASARTKKVRKDEFVAAISALAVTALTGTVVSLQFASGANVSDAQTADLAFSPSGIAAGASEDVAVNMAGVLTTDLLMLAFTEPLPAGLHAQWWISANDTITVRFYNSTSGTITGATYTARCMAVTLS